MIVKSKSKSKKNKIVVGGNFHPPHIPSPTIPNRKPTNFFKNPLKFIHDHILYLNSSKFFAGVIMILLNVGSKFISVNFSKSTEEYLKFTLSKQILVFAMVWMASRDIYTALILTAVFVILSEHLFNEESNLCIVPHTKRVLHKLEKSQLNNNIVTEEELTTAITILEKAKKEKQDKIQKDAYDNFDVSIE
jgi:hypothetical protein